MWRSYCNLTLDSFLVHRHGEHVLGPSCNVRRGVLSIDARAFDDNVCVLWQSHGTGSDSTVDLQMQRNRMIDHVGSYAIVVRFYISSNVLPYRVMKEIRVDAVPTVEQVIYASRRVNDQWLVKATLAQVIWLQSG